MHGYLKSLVQSEHNTDGDSQEMEQNNDEYQSKEHEMIQDQNQIGKFYEPSLPEKFEINNMSNKN